LRHKNGVYFYSSEMQNSTKNLARGTWSEKGWEPLFYKLGLLGNFGQMHGSFSCEVCFFRVLRHNADDWSCAQTLPLCAFAIVVTESDKSNQFMLSFLQVSCSSNKSVVQQERRNCIVNSISQFCLIDVTLHLRSPFHCRASFTTFGLIASGSSTLSNVHHSSILLTINNRSWETHKLCPLPIKETVFYHRGSQPFSDHVPLQRFDRWVCILNFVAAKTPSKITKVHRIFHRTSIF